MEGPKQHFSPQSVRAQMALYEAAVRPPRRRLGRAFQDAWAMAGVATLLWVGWSEPWSARLFARLSTGGWPRWLIQWGLAPLECALRASLLAEAFSYAYHRFLEHPGRSLRRVPLLFRDQAGHRLHHMLLYPNGRLYPRPLPYLAPAGSHTWGWVALGAVTLFARLRAHGVGADSIGFLAAVALYATLLDSTHSRFHGAGRAWALPYFHWLEEIHALHHWDQRYNFGTLHPALDCLFGTYLAPSRHKEDLTAALIDVDLTVSDLINWRHLLLDAAPAEYAVFLSQAQRHPRSLRKLGRLRQLLATRVDFYPNDGLARKLRARAERLWEIVKPQAQAA